MRQNRQMLRYLLSPAECRMKLESVQLERQVIVHGQESKCFSVEPVLHCLPGCFPERTTEVTVGYHCVPAGESTADKVVIPHLLCYLSQS